MYVVGIDPGIDGAIAGLHLGSDTHIRVSKFPHHAVHVGGKRRKRVDLDATWALLQSFACAAPELTVLESVSGRQGQRGGVAFGEVAGALHGMVVAAGLPRHLVPPATWTRAFKLPSKTKAPDASRLMASRLFPKFASLWKTHDEAEAALLAWYGITKVLGYIPT